MRSTTKIAYALAVCALVCSICRADLDKIDADGVTEVGGSSAYARMLPRTGSDGKLASSLLPPVADWASQPIAGLYYVAGGSSSEGNGSPQYPFKSLTYAATHATSGSALLLMPSTYAGSMTISAGSVYTICGMGRSTYISSLSATVTGSSSSTEIRICGARVGTLTVSGGGTINIRLCSATVDQLSGTLSHVTVTRADMGSGVSAASAEYTDVYDGYSTAPNALALTDGNTGSMTLSGGRARVGSSVVAYISDITGATNAVYVSIAAMSAEDARIEGLVTAEATTRESADAAIYVAMSNAVSSLNGSISDIGDNWGEQLTTLSTGMSSLSSGLAELKTKETNDVRILRSEIAAVPYASADLALATTLRSEMNNINVALSSDIAGVQDGVDTNTESIDDLDERVTDLESRTTATESDIADLNTTVGGHTTSINGLATRTSSAEGNISSLQSRVSTVEGSVSSINTTVGTLNTTVSGHSTSISGLSTRMTGAEGDIADVSGDISSLETTVGGHTSSISTMQGSISSLDSREAAHYTSLKSKINEIITQLGNIKNSQNWSVPTAIP